MADRRDHLPFVVGIPDEFQDRRKSSEIVGAVAARYDYGIEGRRVDLLRGGLHLDLEPVLPPVHLAGTGADHDDRGTSLPHPDDRVPELQVLKEILGEHRDPLSG